MNKKNQVNIEGTIINSRLEKLPDKDLSYASMLICSTQKKIDDGQPKTYFRVRFPVSPNNLSQITEICENCQKFKPNEKQHFITVEGQLRYDKERQPFILSKEKDVAINDKEKKEKYNNTVSLEGEIDKVLHKSHRAATVLIRLNDGNNKGNTVPVTFDALKNPVEWANIVNGKYKGGEQINVSGKLDGKIYANALSNSLMTVVSVIAENTINKSKKTTKIEQAKPQIKK